MSGRIRETQVFRRLLVTATVCLAIMAGCASPPRNPFGQAEGPIKLTLVNNGRRPVTATLIGLGEQISLGVFLGGETRFLEFELEGQADISVLLGNLNGGEIYETFRTRAEPGDRFLLEIENDLRLARLIRTRVP